MNPETTCCFTGPRPAKLPMNGNEFTPEILELKSKIRFAVIESYNEGFRFFISGMAEGFDIFAAETVLELKNELPGICLAAALPYSGAPEAHRKIVACRIKKILSRADFIISLSENYIPGCEHSRNRYMVENSTRIIGFYNGLSGGTAHCWNLALKNNLETVNLYESI